MPISFDIETGPLPMDELAKVFPAFDPSKVAMGNTKDPVKQQAKIDEAEANHTLENFAETAALYPERGRVVAIGYYNLSWDEAAVVGYRFSPKYHAAEHIILDNFWYRYKKQRQARGKMIGVNIHAFDLPFITFRSYLLDVEVPGTAMKPGWRYYDDVFVDLKWPFLAGRDPNRTKWSFDAMGAAFGTGGKNVEGITGADFHKLWETDRDKAEEYLKNDVIQPALWAEKMGIL